jgi:hypothetical protein
LLAKLGEHPEYRLFHLGNYEINALRSMKSRLPEEQQEQVQEVLGRAVNVFSIIHRHVYFPTYSCSLKDIGRYIGCRWSEADVSGLKRPFEIGSIAQQGIDLKYFRDGVKRWITTYLSWHYGCGTRKTIFTHPAFPQVATKYGRGLISGCIYQHVACGQSILRVKKGLNEVFKFPIAQPQLYRFKTAVAEHYRATYARILAEMLRGRSPISTRPR